MATFAEFRALCEELWGPMRTADAAIGLTLHDLEVISAFDPQLATKAEQMREEARAALVPV
jgi:hypothetical protein